MTFEEYLDHYLAWKDMLFFFLLALAGAIVCMLIIVLYEKIVSVKVPEVHRKKAYSNSLHNTVQRFYGIVMSGASILSFLSVYYLLDRFLVEPDYRAFWDSNKDFLLLLMIVISIVMNNLFDHFIIPLKRINHDERGALRVIGMIYVIMIFMYIKYIYENPNYDGFIMYFLGLMVGRFIYFDASFKDFVRTMKNALRQLPIMLLGLSYTALMCYFGFKYKYLLKSNGVLVSTFFAHVYMVVAIFLVHHSRILYLFTPKKVKRDPNMSQLKTTRKEMIRNNEINRPVKGPTDNNSTYMG